MARAITMGWDSSGQALLTAMPRYQMAPADLAALIAYLKGMGSVPVPGVSETAVRIGIVLPDDANSRVQRDEIVGTVSEAIRRLNDSGGVFRRRLELTIVEDTRGIGEKVFAVLGGFAPNLDRRLADVESAQVPTVCAVLVPESVGSDWVANPPQSFSGTLFIATAVPSWFGSRTAPVRAAVTLLTEGLKKAGRDLDRESFASAMEQIALVTPGDAVPISFGPGRRVGIQGVCIVRLELRGSSASAVAQTEPQNRSFQQRDGEKRAAAQGRTIHHP